ncbi:Nucleotidyl transferase AbiEii toxin, Type IV TA system [Raineyella antarctica]|uniref:Nucleotidyl transferase AbiEii toxin, Type IV TA system n=1 Tax=Raineyella antarctica TaxID=1577474 RepID=A0A1G6IT20_9ACTN|nr:nucleotidyl transferase AbiEii/AbiGii toxin family protein [Raineyella antarctica]SDC09185.1 Nucleotidyl transferase AbiEii toxin, Type IV TA system [Raineyella antarctica]
MSADGYRDATALWQAVTDRSKQAAKQTGEDPAAYIRNFVYGRFLARVFQDPDAPWVVKGGTAALVRIHDARTTKDIDLLGQLDDTDQALKALRSLLAVDLNDHLRFQITTVEPSLAGGGQPEVDGRRLRVEPYVGASRKEPFTVDLVTGSLLTAEPEPAPLPGIDIPGLGAPTLRLYPLVDHIADKLCAIQAGYGADGSRPSSRVKDLVDLVVFARREDVEGAALHTAILGEWDHRHLAGRPVFTPPASWDKQYPRLARKTAACEGFTDFAMATELVDRFLGPALDGTAHGQSWSAARAAWK